MLYIERYINSSYLCDNDFVICFNTPLLLSFNFPHSIKRMVVANTECYIEKDINFYLLKKIVSFIIILSMLNKGITVFNKLT